MQELKNIINEVFFVDIDVKCRNREVVDARKIYSKILRDKGYSYERIGSSIGKDHATIIHYVRNIEHLLAYDQLLKEKYIACENVFSKKTKSVKEQIQKDSDTYATLIRLTNELEEAILRNDKMLNEFVDYIEEYNKKNGFFPSIYDYRHTILPLFNK